MARAPIQKMLSNRVRMIFNKFNKYSIKLRPSAEFYTSYAMQFHCHDIIDMM